MRSLLLGVLCALLLIGGTNAQTRNMSLGAGVVVSFPMGDFGDAANTGIGGTAQFELAFMPQLVGVAQIGYISWGTDVEDYSFSSVPVLAGVKYFFVPGVGFYGIGQIGLSFLSFNTPTYEFFGQSYGGSETSTEFTLLLGAGYEIPVSPNFSLDFTGAINIISDSNNFTLRAGGKFAL